MYGPGAACRNEADSENKSGPRVNLKVGYGWITVFPPALTVSFSICSSRRIRRMKKQSKWMDCMDAAD